MPRIFGVDPGSQITGYGIIDVDPGRSRHVDSGCIRTAAGDPLATRLGLIFARLSALIDEFAPDTMAIEQVFMARNADAALKLGQARGAAICAGARAGLTVSEYAPRAVKQAVVGRGAADKRQVQHMVCVLLKLPERPQADAADALAVALCHGHMSATGARAGVAPALLLRRRR